MDIEFLGISDYYKCAYIFFQTNQRFEPYTGLIFTVDSAVSVQEWSISELKNGFSVIRKNLHNTWILLMLKKLFKNLIFNN